MQLLKHLELNGFKSFAEKTVLEFPNGITAIVGPNGSGKSNIIDAIRWLLGEREAKNLRGGKGEDLIFAGSAKRPRMGLGQATLYFDNRNKFFPLEFSEISVSRQVARDGNNKYFLNKSEVRLKDLIDFFAASRLGTKGFVIVTQGNSDIFVRVSPKERREMLEEVLGLREYQIKRLEAERRLKNTQINLDKAKALLEEILPHLRSLKRQTSRWDKRGVLEEELRALENQFFGARHWFLRQNILEIQKEIGDRGQEREILEKARVAAEKELKDIEANGPKEMKELGEVKAEIQKILENRSHLQKELGRLEAQMEFQAKAQEKTSVSLDHALDFIRKSKTRLEKALSGSMDDLQFAIKEMLSEINGILDVAVGKIPTSQKSIPAELEEKFRDISRDMGGLQKDMDVLRGKEKILEKNQEQFYSLFKSGVAKVDDARRKMEALESWQRQKESEKDRLQFRLSELERQIEQAERTPAEFAGKKPQTELAEPELLAAESRIFKLRAEIAGIGEVDSALISEAKSTEERYEFLKNQSAELEKAKNDLKDLISDLRKKIKTEFEGAMHQINEEFDKFFKVMFEGGQAKLKIQKPAPKIIGELNEEGVESAAAAAMEAGGEAEEEKEEGVEITLSLPKKRINSLEMLSGGEKSLVGIAALFAMISVSPPPFLVLDEIDAPLDERNARRFSEMLKEFSKKTQFVVVTHNRATMEAADVLYGVTLNEDGTSKILSLKLEG